MRHPSPLNNSGKVVTSVWHIFLERWTCFPVYKIILYHVWWRNSTQLLAICQLGCFQHYLFQYLIKLGEILNSNSTLFQNLTFSLNFEYSAGNIGNILNGTEKAYPIRPRRWYIFWKDGMSMVFHMSTIGINGFSNGFLQWKHIWILLPAHDPLKIVAGWHHNIC